MYTRTSSNSKTDLGNVNIKYFAINSYKQHHISAFHSNIQLEFRQKNKNTNVSMKLRFESNIRKHHSHTPSNNSISLTGPTNTKSKCVVQFVVTHYIHHRQETVKLINLPFSNIDGKYVRFMLKISLTHNAKQN